MIHQDAIIFNDSYITVVNKPHGLQCEPDKNGYPDLCTELRRYLNSINKPPKILQPVNRIDRPVGGLVLFAKTATALRALNKMQELRNINKTYTALVEGSVDSPNATLQHYLLKDLLEKRAIVSDEETKGSKLCTLDYELVSHEERASRLRINLRTGRYHQIRAQLSFVNHPIVGDLYYGAHNEYEKNAICLHASALSFAHPITGVGISLESEPLF